VTVCSGKQSHILALDTVGGNIAACIISDGRQHILPPDKHNSGITRSTAITPALHGLLEQAGLNWTQLDVLALGAGPGSFTGLRIAAATLAGINAGLHLPIVHLSSLAITARQADSQEAIRVLEDARAGELFYGSYQQGNAMEADCCLRWRQLETCQPGLFCSVHEPPVSLEGWTRTALSISRSQALALEAKAACERVMDWSCVPAYPSPNYLQLSQAERNSHAAA